MPFYLVSDDNGCIVESLHSRPTQEELQQQADYFGCALYVIDGEHAGLTASPKPSAEALKNKSDPPPHDEPPFSMHDAVPMPPGDADGEPGMILF